MPLTLQERERIAYIEGRTQEAELLGEMMETTDATIIELREERDDLKKDVDRMERENRNLEDDLEAAEEKVLTLTSDLENAQDEVKALQSQIHEAGVDLL